MRLNEVVTTGANHTVGLDGSTRARNRFVAAVLRFLSEKLGLEGEDVIQDPVDTAAFQPMVGDHPGPLRWRRSNLPRGPSIRACPCICATSSSCRHRSSASLPRSVLANTHVRRSPSTSTRPAAVTRT